MSARFYKIFSVVLLMHILIFNMIWVGFPAPFPRPPAVFTYEGALPAEEGAEARDAWPKGQTPDQFVFDRLEASDFNHWIKLRDASK